ncbi:SDR family NAD(P)-dependent oxidoreductase [Mycolicibacterium sp. F2034L]|uniref:SDR family NAD(P)-dependent oxidoreductase n=1 Tax=Mycolicibacterium sp. F2034L TaxID=2926422 RepID=UPI001FF2E3EC|nr:SDR family oxidoreductase [Mycolicibacterium sp. F2034L]MCK0176995.1 SDR family oxidoreductase [Mycolicibacterium sp. F2034L]
MPGVIVTGGASGIGRASADALIADGHRVILWDIAPEVTAAGEALGVPAAVVDVCDGAQIAAATTSAAETLSGIDGLVHAAGRVIPEPVGTFTEDSWDAVLDVNLRAQAMITQLILPYLQESARSGAHPAIVGISSIEGLQANPFIPAYCASKAGLLGLTRSMAAQLGPEGIRVNAVCPGFIETPMLQIALDVDEVREGFISAAPLGRLGQPGDVGAAVAFLMSPKASFITGSHLVVDGGVTSRHP